MAFCKKCGTSLPDDKDICSACSNGTVENTINTGLDDVLNEITNTKDITSEFNINDIEDNKIISILSYINILVLVPIFGAKESKFARFHANQGLILFITGIILAIVASVIRIIPFLGELISWILSILTGGYIVVFMLLGIINTAMGKAKELPIIGKYRLLK